MSYAIDPLTGQVRVSGGNATVPPDAPIQPPQAFVDASVAIIGGSALGGTVFSLNGYGIASLDASRVFANCTQNGVEVDLSNNALDSDSVDGVLSQFLANGGSGLFIDLSGGTSAAPTQNAAIVSGAGTPDVIGAFTQRGTNLGKFYYNLIGQADSIAVWAIVWSGTQWVITNGSGAQYGSDDGDIEFPWNVVSWSPLFGNTPAPTVTSTNGDQANLIAVGCTINTN